MLLNRLGFLAALLSSVHGISNEPCCYQSRKCARWLPKNARDNLFRCQSGYELKYRDPIRAPSRRGRGSRRARP